jgi:hypothetical protein
MTMETENALLDALDAISIGIGRVASQLEKIAARMDAQAENSGYHGPTAGQIEDAVYRANNDGHARGR